MMDNKQLAEELILRFAGYPQPALSMVQEAAKRLLQLVPDHPVKAGGMDADALRQLAAEWPLKENPWMDPEWTNEDYLRCVCISAADRIEQMAETIDYARTINAENTRLTAELAKVEAERDALNIDKLNLTAMVEQLEKARVERDAVFEYLKNGHLGNGCTFCKHYFTESDKDPCKPCMAGRGKPNWEWRGANPWKD